MGNVMAIAGRELKTYLTSPFSYVMMGGYAFLGGFFYTWYVGAYSQMSTGPQDPFSGMGEMNLTEHLVGPYYTTMFLIMVFLAPLLTMRLIAEDRKQRSIELLITSPVSSWAIVLGKFLGAMGLFLLMQLAVIYQPLALFYLSEPELGPLLSTYAGVLLTGGAFLAVGLALSSLTENQIIAAAGTFCILLTLWVVEGLSQVFSGGGGGSVGDVGEFLKFISLIGHLENFTKGVLDTRDALFFLSFIAFFLFLAQQRIEALRWR